MLSPVSSWIGNLLVAALLLWVPVRAQRIVDVQLAARGTADLCGDRQVVVTISLSTPLYASDSLLLFEFAVGYDPVKLQFIAPLFTGTVAEGADYSGSGAIDSATVRVYAFNVTRPLRGTGPLCGLLFRYPGECPDTVTVRLVLPPEKNAEAKLEFGQLGTALVEAVEHPSSSLKAQFPYDTAFVALGVERELSLEFNVPAARVRTWSFLLRGSRGLRLNRLALAANDSLTLVVESSDSSELYAQIVCPSVLQARKVRLTCSAQLHRSEPAQLEVVPELPHCACVASVQGDTVSIVPDETVSVTQRAASSLKYARIGEEWKLWDLPEQAVELVAWDSLGRFASRVAITGLPVIVRADCWSPVLIRLRDGSVIRTILR
ncbi:MAG: hypothetical protein KatS3mg039_1728 [Candidatus Kapaibacterium sp.]|nr:MAG: hypothetical protein KatS3mg039_1728 [Candidatus Kapabacteria bacterium]GIV55312.1 MAG: hypothetical protein KatS3mg040_0080 [Candidatus Kapabacteria bacterium]